jgi:hypothetical protein
MTPLNDGHVRKIVARMHASPANIDYKDLVKVCEHYFGTPRQRGSSHAVFAKPWEGDPRVNIQSDRGRAKAYQVQQVLKAIARLERGA